MKTIASAGYKTGNYSNKDYLNRFFDNDIKNNYDIWLAHVADGKGNPLTTSNYTGQYIMHQYSWVGRTQGFLSNTDMDFCFVNYSTASNISKENKKTYQIPENIKFLTDVNKNVITNYIYSKSKDKFLSDHFQVKEFASGNGEEKVKIHNKLIIILEALFKELDCSKIIVTSGYRTKEKDIAVGGSGTGYHTLGRAADVICYDKQGNIIPAKKVCCALEDMGGIYGIGYISPTAVHIDTRPKNKKWWGDETKKNSPAINSFHDYFNI